MPYSGSIRVILGENVLLGRPQEKQEIRQALVQPYRLLHVVLSFHPNLRIQLFHGILSGFRAVAISANFEHGACVALNIFTVFFFLVTRFSSVERATPDLRQPNSA